MPGAMVAGRTAVLRRAVSPGSARREGNRDSGGEGLDGSGHARVRPAVCRRFCQPARKRRGRSGHVRSCARWREHRAGTGAGHVRVREKDVAPQSVPDSVALTRMSAKGAAHETLLFVHMPVQATLVQMLAMLTHDLRDAARNLRRNRGFAASAIAVLAIGIAASTGLFAVVDAV